VPASAAVLDEVTHEFFRRPIGTSAPTGVTREALDAVLTYLADGKRAGLLWRGRPDALSNARLRAVQAEAAELKKAAGLDLHRRTAHGGPEAAGFVPGEGSGAK